MIFYVVICSPGQILRQLFPAIPMNFMHFKKLYLLYSGPLGFDHMRIKMIIPSLSTLFASSLFFKSSIGNLSEKLSIFCPVLTAIGLDNFFQLLIFLSDLIITSNVQLCRFIVNVRIMLYIFIIK